MGGLMRDEIIAILRARVEKTSQAQVARELGLHYSTISKILSGESGMRLATVQRIIDTYPEAAALFSLENILEAEDVKEYNRMS